MDSFTTLTRFRASSHPWCLFLCISIQSTGRSVYVVASTLLVFANFISASRTGVATMILAFVAMGLFFYRGRDRNAVKALFLVFLVGFCSFLLFSEAKDALMLKGVDRHAGETANRNNSKSISS